MDKWVMMLKKGKKYNFLFALVDNIKAVLLFAHISFVFL
jgi:hypothetical protein